MRVLALLVTVLSLGVAKALRWLGQYLEDSVGKQDEAFEALDKAIDDVEAYVASDEATDAAGIMERVTRLRAVLAPAPGQPVDAATGTPVDMNSTLGPDSPNLDAGAAPQSAADPGAVTEDGEVVNAEHPETNN